MVQGPGNRLPVLEWTRHAFPTVPQPGVTSSRAPSSCVVFQETATMVLRSFAHFCRHRHLGRRRDLTIRVSYCLVLEALEQRALLSGGLAPNHASQMTVADAAPLIT